MLWVLNQSDGTRSLLDIAERSGLAFRGDPRRGRAAASTPACSPTRQEPSMRVLVTGHHGYIGSVLAPCLRDAGHDVVGLDTVLLPRLRLRRRAGVDAGARLDVRDVGPRTSRASTPSSTSRALERPARRPGPGLDVRHQPEATRSSRARAKEAGVGASSSRPRAACTGPPRATSCSTRVRRCAR